MKSASEGTGAYTAMIAGIDHVVLTVRSVDDTCDFYQLVLGMKRLDEVNRPTALSFGSQKINLHEVSRTFEPKAMAPTSGSGDFGLVVARPLSERQPGGQWRCRGSRAGRADRCAWPDDVGVFSRSRW